MIAPIPAFEPIKVQSINVVIKQEKEKPKEYIIEYGDTLTSIAQKQHTSVEKLFAKNTTLANPDVIKPGEVLVVPSESEVVEERPLPSATIDSGANSSLQGSAVTGASSNLGGLTGSIGYAIAGGNCVDTAKANGKNQPGNPDTWVASTQEPFIGAAALFHYNHVGIVVGIWENGDLEIAHENYSGGQHRFPRSDFRGFF